MNKIGDDELGLILSQVTDPDDRKSVSEVCKLWRVMEGLGRSSLRVLNLDHLPRLLARYPNLTIFKTPKKMSIADLAMVAQVCPKLQAFILQAIPYPKEVVVHGDETIDEFMEKMQVDNEVGVLEKMRVVNEVGDEGLCALADGCPNLSKIVLRRNRVGLCGIIAMITSAAHNLTRLDLENCYSNLDLALEAIGSSSCAIRLLNLKGCSKITDVGLRFLANGSCSETIKKLNLVGCRKITDAGVLHLCKMRVLEELYLAFCNKLTDVGGQAISTIRTLKKLNLACLQSLTEKTFVALGENCINLEVLDVQHCGMEVTAASMDAFSGHKCLRSLNLVGCLSDDFRGPTLQSVPLQFPKLKFIGMQELFSEAVAGNARE